MAATTAIVAALRELRYLVVFLAAFFFAAFFLGEAFFAAFLAAFLVAIVIDSIVRRSKIATRLANACQGETGCEDERIGTRASW